MPDHTNGRGAPAALTLVAAACGLALLFQPAPHAFSSLQTAAARVLLATVQDRTNQPVVDLEADDFVVEEDGQPREVLSVHVADYPVVLLLDTSAAPSDQTAIRSAAARFLRRVGEDRPVAVATLANPAAMIASFEDSRQAALDRLDRPSDPAAGAGGAPAPLEAMNHAAALVEALGAPFSAIVLVWQPPLVDDARAEGSAPLAPILDSRAIVHVVSRRPPPPADPPAAGAYDRVMRELTSTTGGQFTTIYSPGSYSVALDRIADRMATELMVEFLVPAAGTGNRPVRAGVRIPGARVIGLRVSP